MRTIRIAVLSTLVASTAATAQPSIKSSGNTGRGYDLIAQADQITTLTDFGEKARLLEKGARMLPADDPRAAYALFAAGQLSFHLGKPDRAIELLARAASGFSSAGLPGQAATALVDASLVALQQRHREDARRYIDQAMVLVTSDKIGEQERTTVLRRLATPLAVLTSPQR